MYEHIYQWYSGICSIVLYSDINLLNKLSSKRKKEKSEGQFKQAAYVRRAVGQTA